MPPADVGVQPTSAHPVSVPLPPPLSPALTSQPPPPSQHQQQQQQHLVKEIGKQPTYFGIEVNFKHPTSPSQHSRAHSSQTEAVTALIDSFFAQNKDIKVPPIWTTLKRTGRVQDAFHVTLVHANQGRAPSSSACSSTESGASSSGGGGGGEAGNREAQTLYRRFCDLHQQQLIRQHHHQLLHQTKHKHTQAHIHRQKSRPLELGPTFNVTILRLAWTDELMVFEVQISPSTSSACTRSSPASSSFSSSSVCMNEVPHITIGTRSPAVPAVKSGLVLAAARHSSNSGSSGSLVIKDWNIEPRVISNQPLTAYP